MAVFNLKKLWKKKPDRLGIDLDERSVRVVNLKRVGEDRFEVSACGSIDVSVKPLSTQDQERLRAFLKQMGGRLTKAAIKIEDPSLRIRYMNLAKMPDRDLLEVIRWNFREHVDCPIEQYRVSYTPIKGWGDSDRISCAAFGVSNQAIKEHLEIARLLGFHPVSLEPQATALLAAFDYNLKWQTKHPVVCISLGEFFTYFTVMEDGQLIFSRPMPGITLDRLAKNLERDLNVDKQRAYEIMAQYIASSEKKQPEHAQILSTFGSFYSQLVVEIQRSIDAFCILFETEHVKSIYLCDRGAYCPGITAHMQESLGIPTEIFDPFACVANEQLDPQVKAFSAIYAVAFGLAIP